MRPMLIIRTVLTIALLLPVPYFLPIQSGAYAHETGLRMGRDPRDHLFGRGHIPECTDSGVFSRIARKFQWADRNTWSEIAHRHEIVRLEDITRIKQKYSLDHTKSLIRHRHCNGKAHLSNGRTATIHYVISERQGFASMGWNVQFCIIGHDRWKVYGAHCRSLR